MAYSNPTAPWFPGKVYPSPSDNSWTNTDQRPVLPPVLPPVPNGPSSGGGVGVNPGTRPFVPGPSPQSREDIFAARRAAMGRQGIANLPTPVPRSMRGNQLMTGPAQIPPRMVPIRMPDGSMRSMPIPDMGQPRFGNTRGGGYSPRTRNDIDPRDPNRYQFDENGNIVGATMIGWNPNMPEGGFNRGPGLGNTSGGSYQLTPEDMLRMRQGTGGYGPRGGDPYGAMTGQYPDWYIQAGRENRMSPDQMAAEWQRVNGGRQEGNQLATGPAPVNPQPRMRPGGGGGGMRFQTPDQGMNQSPFGGGMQFQIPDQGMNQIPNYGQGFDPYEYFSQFYGGFNF